MPVSVQIYNRQTICVSMIHNIGRSLFVIDIDNDNDLDLLTDYSLDRGLAWYQNDNQQFTRISIDPDNNISPREIVALDFDLDGDIDIAATSIFENSIYYLENDGNQNFLKSTIATDFELSLIHI